MYKNDRCDTVRNGKHVGKKHCPHSCGYCDDDWRKPTRKPTKKPTRKPTKKPTRKPTKKPTRKPSSPTKKPTHKPTHKPTYKPTPKPTHKPTPKPTHKPTSSSCHSSVDLDRYCYDDEEHHPETLTVHFENCHPEDKDWIGIYKSKDGQTMEWSSHSYMWKYACGSKDCDYSEDFGTIHFRSWWEDLDGGDYKVYLFEDNGYHVKASSDEFEVGDCGYRKPTRKPTYYRKPTKKPTKKPTRKPNSYECRSSVEVEQYCYEGQHPQKLEVSFKNCHPASKDWIGIYHVQHGHLGQTLQWWGNSFMWKFTCGSKKCYYPEDYGAVYFGSWWNDLSNGQYKAYLFEDDGYRVKASSETFKVGNCW